jgi:hypothetical protein
MKKLISLLLMIGMATSSYAVDITDFMRGDSSDVIKGTSGVSDVDTELAAYLTDPLERLIPGSIYGCTLTWATNATVTIGVGSVVCSNAAGTIHRIRKNTSTVTITLPASGASGDSLDTGNAAISTFYHVFAIADADATTFTAKCSASASAPTGATYYRYLGSFYNNASDNIAMFYWFGNGNFIRISLDTIVSITTTPSAGAWAGETTCSAGIPVTSTLGIFNVNCTASAGGYYNQVALAPFGSTSTTIAMVSHFTADTTSIDFMVTCPLSTTQTINYWQATGAIAISIGVAGYYFSR